MGCAFNGTVDAPCYETAPEEDASAKEGQDCADGDEDGAFGEGGFLHERSVGGIGNDQVGNTSTGDGG